MNDAPKMSPEEAEARFAALVAEHRGRKPDGKPGPRVGRAPLNGTVAVVLVFLFGLFAGIVGHSRPVLAALGGGAVLLIVRALWLRGSNGGRDE